VFDDKIKASVVGMTVRKSCGTAVIKSELFLFKPKKINTEYTNCKSVPVAARSKRSSTAARLLRSWVRIPPEAWMFVCCVCWLSGRSLRDKLITRPEEAYRLWPSLCVNTKPRERGHSPRWAAEPEQIVTII
jgi:hypothetical protein